MNFKAEVLKMGVKALGGIERGEFITAGGKPMNNKIEMGVLRKSRLLRGLMIGEIAARAEAYQPDLIVPIPTGADEVGQDVARRLDNCDSLLLEWADKKPGSKRLVVGSSEGYRRLQRAERIVLVDDVFTTGSSLRAVQSIPALYERTLAAIVMWNRSHEGRVEQMPFSVEAVIEEYVPLVEEQ